MTNDDLSARFPGRALSWKLRTRTLTFDRTPKLMAIVNVTPDSFSDGGSYFDPLQAIEHALRCAEEGAAILDIGGESTRPYSQPVDTSEELRRVIPVIARLSEVTDVPISIDTSKAVVAREAIAAGAQIINDVTGLTGDPYMIEAALESGVGVCAMHMQGTPQTMQDDPHYDDVVEDIFAYLAERRDALIAVGIETERICLDPGVGFGKTHQHNLELMAACGRYHELERPLLVGHSRKGFIGKFLENAEAPRTFGTVGGTLALARQGVQIIRVHDVRENFEALRLFVACGGADGTAGVIPS
ncbi:dihydropteroate synthase [Blastopirellula sp. JC732]|uniref:Dihydropteroate synthase n=1 Tax=Blastopirellula sediminis TaxID=2894196 RepID=A0A9X1MHG8_9BACT|nr:dihydropteroate synthase [Blastopirellula sediminis]MCC9604336.1 dihydropteroate synthase [Blastopirellula sediminis]MCC9626856.1 dihydropteroate synthase [Blastopirellula sediminis]